MTKEECEIETSKAIMEMKNHIEKLEKENADLEESNKEWQRTCEAKSDTNSQLIEQLADKVEKIEALEKENAELKAKIYGGGYEAVITKKDADIILLEHLLKEQKELHKSVCNQLTHTHKNLRNQLTYAKTIIQDLLDNTDEYARQKAEVFLKENE